MPVSIIMAAALGNNGMKKRCGMLSASSRSIRDTVKCTAQYTASHP